MSQRTPMRPLHAAAVVSAVGAVLLVGGAVFVQSRRLSSDRVVLAPTSSVPIPATSGPIPPTPTAVVAATIAPAVAVAAPATAVVMVQTPATSATNSDVMERPATALPPREGVVLSIPILSVDGTEQPILPGTPTPVAPWWQRVDGPVPDSVSKPLLDSYLRFWDARAQALSTLDSSSLSQVLAGPPLVAELTAIDRLRSSGQLQRVNVDHSIELLWATPEEGGVRDTLLDRSQTVSADEPPDAVPTPTPQAYRMAYRLTLINGVWKVTESVRLAR